MPSWSNDPNPKLKPINARAETFLDRPAFREAFLHKRCLIPADGFYEWAKTKPAKTPYHIRLKGGGLFTFAGLWDVWHGEGKPVETFCVITTAANELVKPLHDRMSVIVGPADYAAWLDPETPTDALVTMLRPYPAEEMDVVRVGSAVNSTKNDGPECLVPAAVKKLKAEREGEIRVWGSTEPITSRADPIDEYWLAVSPIVPGTGKGPFSDGFKLTSVPLIESRALKSGVPINTYRRGA